MSSQRRKRAEMMTQLAGGTLPPVVSPTRSPQQKARKLEIQTTAGKQAAAPQPSPSKDPQAAKIAALPSELKLLRDFFGAMLSARAMLRGRAPTLEALQPMVQQLCGHTFKLQHLQQIKHLHPAGFSWRYLQAPSAKDPTRQEYQLSLGFENRNAGAASPSVAQRGVGASAAAAAAAASSPGGATATAAAAAASPGGGSGDSTRYDAAVERRAFDELLLAHFDRAQASGGDPTSVPLAALPSKDQALVVGQSPSASMQRSRSLQMMGHHSSCGSPCGSVGNAVGSPMALGGSASLVGTPTAVRAAPGVVREGGGTVLDDLLNKIDSTSKPPPPMPAVFATPTRSAQKPPRAPQSAGGGGHAAPPISAAKRSLLLTMLSPENVARLEAAEASKVVNTPDAVRRRERTQALAMLPRAMDVLCSVFEFGPCVKPRAEVAQKMIDKATFRAGLTLNEASLQIMLLSEHVPELVTLEPAARGQPAMVRVNRKFANGDTRRKLTAVVSALAVAASPSIADAAVRGMRASAAPIAPLDLSAADVAEEAPTATDSGATLPVDRADSAGATVGGTAGGAVSGTGSARPGGSGAEDAASQKENRVPTGLHENACAKEAAAGSSGAEVDAGGTADVDADAEPDVKQLEAEGATASVAAAGAAAAASEGATARAVAGSAERRTTQGDTGGGSAAQAGSSGRGGSAAATAATGTSDGAAHTPTTAAVSLPRTYTPTRSRNSPTAAGGASGSSVPPATPTRRILSPEEAHRADLAALNVAFSPEPRAPRPTPSAVGSSSKKPCRSLAGSAAGGTASGTTGGTAARRMSEASAFAGALQRQLAPVLVLAELVDGDAPKAPSEPGIARTGSTSD